MGSGGERGAGGGAVGGVLVRSRRFEGGGSFVDGVRVRRSLLPAEWGGLWSADGGTGGMCWWLGAGGWAACDSRGWGGGCVVLVGVMKGYRSCRARGGKVVSKRDCEEFLVIWLTSLRLLALANTRQPS